MMRGRIYTLVAKSTGGDWLSRLYDCFIMAVAVLSIVPLMFRVQEPPIFAAIETVTVYLLFFDYMLRWMTHDIHSGRKGPLAFVLYPFTPLAIMDILGLLPSLGLLPPSFMVLRLLRLTVLLRYSESCRRIANVFRTQRKTLLSVLLIAVAYIFISALVMFVYEPTENFPTFFDALYWATTALTTVGYGDIYPKTDLGRFVSMISSLFGVAVIAMPASIVTAGFLSELERDMKDKEVQPDDIGNDQP